MLKCFMDVFGLLLKNLLFLNSLADKLLSMCQIEKTSLHISTSGVESGKRIGVGIWGGLLGQDFVAVK